MGFFNSHCVQRNWTDSVCSEKLLSLLINEKKALIKAAIRKDWTKLRHCWPEQGEELITGHVWVNLQIFYSIFCLSILIFFLIKKYILLFLRYLEGLRMVVTGAMQELET